MRLCTIKRLRAFKKVQLCTSRIRALSKSRFGRQFEMQSKIVAHPRIPLARIHKLSRCRAPPNL